MPGGEETDSIVICKRPNLNAAYLMTSSEWDGYLNVLSEERTAVYGDWRRDNYNGSGSLKEAYQTLHELYEKQGLTGNKRDKLLVLDERAEIFFDRGFRDQHAGGLAFALDETIIGWLFGEH